MLGAPRLHQVATDLPAVDGIDRGADVRVGRHDHARGVGAESASAFAELDSGHARHALVGDEHCDLLAPQDVERGFRRARGQDAELTLEGVRERAQELGLVIDVEDEVTVIVAKHLDCAPLARDEPTSCLAESSQRRAQERQHGSVLEIERDRGRSLQHGRRHADYDEVHPMPIEDFQDFDRPSRTLHRRPVAPSKTPRRRAHRAAHEVRARASSRSASRPRRLRRTPP